MTRLEEYQIQNLQDIWAKLYIYLAKSLTEDLGIEGERALRHGIRNFGIDRGGALREKHLETGMKLNLYNLFTYYDLPGDPRFRRNKISLTPQERLSETLVCPIADMWESMGGKKLGRIYCEEFHHAMFGTYAPKAQVNLSQTLTQEGDNHCRFSVYLRPANMDSEERKISFEEFDPEFKEEKVKEYEMPSAREGFEMLCIKLYYNIALTALSRFGEKARESLGKALEEFAADVAAFLKKQSLALGEVLDEKFIEANCPISIMPSKTAEMLWNSYADKEPKEIFEQTFFPAFKKALKI